MVKYIFLCICICGSLFGANLTKGISKSISEIKADDIDYNGKKICLTGSVRIDHHLGMLHCDKAELVLAEGHKDSKNVMPSSTKNFVPFIFSSSSFLASYFRSSIKVRSAILAYGNPIIGESTGDLSR